MLLLYKTLLFLFFIFKCFFDYQDVDKAKVIYENIKDDEKLNGMQLDIIEKGKKILMKD